MSISLPILVRNTLLHSIFNCWKFIKVAFSTLLNSTLCSLHSSKIQILKTQFFIFLKFQRLEFQRLKIQENWFFNFCKFNFHQVFKVANIAADTEENWKMRKIKETPFWKLKIQFWFLRSSTVLFELVENLRRFKNWIFSCLKFQTFENLIPENWISFSFQQSKVQQLETQQLEMCCSNFFQLWNSWKLYCTWIKIEENGKFLENKNSTVKHLIFFLN